MTSRPRRLAGAHQHRDGGEDHGPADIDGLRRIQRRAATCRSCGSVHTGRWSPAAPFSRCSASLPWNRVQWGPTAAPEALAPRLHRSPSRSLSPAPTTRPSHDRGNAPTSAGALPTLTPPAGGRGEHTAGVRRPSSPERTEARRAIHASLAQDAARQVGCLLDEGWPLADAVAAVAGSPPTTPRSRPSREPRCSTLVARLARYPHYFVVPDLDLAGERHRRRALRPALRRSSVNGRPAPCLTGLRQGDITMDHYQSSTLDRLQRHFDHERAELEAEQVPRIRAALADQLDTLSLHDPLRGKTFDG